MRNFLKTNRGLIAIKHIVAVDLTKIEEDLILWAIDIHGDEHIITGLDVLEAVLLLNPAAVEGRRMKWWKKGAWAVHNIIGHPLMQILAWAGKPKWGIWVHDVTVPKAGKL